VIEVNASDGSTRILVDERSTTFINYTRVYRKMLWSNDAMLWSSERSGSEKFLNLLMMMMRI
jgi:hypothetical protein